MCVIHVNNAKMAQAANKQVMALWASSMPSFLKKKKINGPLKRMILPVGRKNKAQSSEKPVMSMI